MNVLYFAIGLIAALGFNIYNQPAPSFSAALPQTPAGFETSLAAPITSSATSMTLTANSTRGGTALSGYNCFTIDAGSAQAEYVCGTVSGTAVSSLTRGIDDVTGTTTNATLQFSHRRGASVQVTDFPAIQIMRAQLNGQDTVPNLMTYANTVLIGVGAPTTTLTTKHYVDSVAVAGASNADDTTKGISERATATEAGAGTALGSTGAALFLGANIATSTCQAVGFSVLIASSTTGKLNANCLNTAYPYAWTAIQTFQATTSFATTTQKGVVGGIAPTGSILAYASSTAPAGWLSANGTSYATSTYPDLFSTIGYTYGGSGANFNVPNLLGRNPLMASTTANMGQSGGESNHTLTEAEMPSHDHGGTYVTGSGGGGSGLLGVTNANGSGTFAAVADGGGTAHNVLDPYLTTWYIIKY